MADYYVREAEVFGLKWQVILQDWGIHRPEANIAYSHVVAQIGRMRERDAVQLHAMLIRVSERGTPAPAGDPPPPLGPVEMPLLVIEIERNARRVALEGWPSHPKDTHSISIGALP